jgi:hypothetical protein
MKELIQAIASETGADERTVAKWFAGLKLRGAAGRAIERACAARGIAQPNAPLAISSMPKPVA